MAGSFSTTGPLGRHARCCPTRQEPSGSHKHRAAIGWIDTSPRSQGDELSLVPTVPGFSAHLHYMHRRKTPHQSERWPSHHQSLDEGGRRRCTVCSSTKCRDRAVRLLLAYRVCVTNTLLDAARESPNKELLRTLELYQRNPISRPPPPPPLLELSDTALAEQVLELNAGVAILESRAAEAEEKVRVAERKLSDGQTNTAALEARNSVLDQ
ncbi:hypothetical protein M427DRAFT_247119 [Gonapodya prolifera JEL478]|uniref:Uncharacterized protein n=1 Tax=Gonapodya prolifera (strain JEL478) TaxID=1344416 RepID=A0A139AM52_GONPJ|nr:hypothetical protein M427DRAFT_247119 [Gonapodya prolifera JEL478]|eukprot:KXS17839.1 hypothetical protein M427DRAFT_247119 [Gonapodya prolifera JEL478]